MSDFSGAEAAFAAQMTKLGYTVLQAGWPDFLIVPPGPSESIFAVELKSGSDPLRSAQEPLHAALRRAGLPVAVVRVPDADDARRVAFVFSSRRVFTHPNISWTYENQRKDQRKSPPQNTRRPAEQIEGSVST